MNQLVQDYTKEEKESNLQQGKEYYGNGQLRYDGEYKDGKFHGKGKDYHMSGQLFYEGEYKDGKRAGQGKFYDEYGRIVCEGEWQNGKLIERKSI